MTYVKKLIVVVKNNNKVLREQDGCVFIPFGSEYSILIKNLESRRALVSISIDGTDILYGKQLVIDPNKEIEIERFLENLNLGSRLKFIQKTKEISDFRGDKLDDGFIRIEFRFEKEKPIKVTTFIQEDHYHYNHYPYYPHYTISYGNNSLNQPTFGNQNIFCSSNIGQSIGSTSNDISINYCANTNCNQDVSFQNFKDEGITVPGSNSNQQFKTTLVDELEENSYTIILRLKGIYSGGQPIQKIVSVRDKIVCSICGKKNRSNFKFCTNCSAALT